MTLSIDDAKALVIDFCATYPVASSLGYKLRETQEELYGPHATREAAGTILGSFHPGGGRVLFATSNFGSDEEFKRSLRHEVLGHFGINTFNPAEKRALLDGIIEACNEPSTAAIWAKVDQLYPGISDSRKAEEVFAFVCEDIESLAYGNAIGGAQSFRETCIECTRPMQISDLINVTTMVAEGLHDRSRSQQIFPASDDAQFKLETTPNISEYPVWLAVPHDAREVVRAAAGKLENGQSAIGWDKESSLWFARPGADLDRLVRWMPDTSIRSGGGDPETEFLDVLTREGLVIQGMPVMDGLRHRVATVEDKKGNKSGVYRGYLDRRPGGWFINYHRAETEKSVTKWSASGGESDPMARLHIRAAARQSQEDAVRVREQLYAQQTLAAKRLYDRLPGADPAHPYLVRKGIPPTPDLRQTRNGALVVPFFNASGTFKTLQYIPRDGEKYLFKDAPKQGHFLVVGGSLTPGQPVLYAEGYATARSANLATGLPVVMTIDAGNMVAVAKVLHEQLPDCRHVFLADLDHAKKENKGLLMATAAAEQVGGQVLYPAFTDEEKARGLTDFNDLHQSRGLDALRNQIGPVLAHDNEVSTMQEEKDVLDPAATSALVDSVLPSAAPAPLTFTHNGQPATIDLERFQPQVEQPATQASPIAQDEKAVNGPRWIIEHRDTYRQPIETVVIGETDSAADALAVFLSKADTTVIDNRTGEVEGRTSWVRDGAAPEWVPSAKLEAMASMEEKGVYLPQVRTGVSADDQRLAESLMLAVNHPDQASFGRELLKRRVATATIDAFGEAVPGIRASALPDQWSGEARAVPVVTEGSYEAGGEQDRPIAPGEQPSHWRIEVKDVSGEWQWFAHDFDANGLTATAIAQRLSTIGEMAGLAPEPSATLLVEPQAAPVVPEPLVVPAPLTFTYNGEPASLGLKSNVTAIPTAESLAAEWTANQLDRLNARSATEQSVFAEVEGLLKNQKFELRTQISALRKDDTRPDSDAVQGHKSTIHVINLALKEMNQHREYDGDPDRLPLLDRFKYDQSRDEQGITQGRGIDGTTRDEWVKQQMQQPGSAKGLQAVGDKRSFQVERTARAEALLSRVLILGSNAGVTDLIRGEISARNTENNTLAIPSAATKNTPELATTDAPTVVQKAALDNPSPAAVEVKPEAVAAVDETTRAQRRAEEQLSMALEPTMAPTANAETVIAPIVQPVERQELESETDSTAPDATPLSPAPSAQPPEQETPVASDDPAPVSRLNDAGNGTSPVAANEADAILVGAPRPSGTEVEPQISHMDLDSLLARVAWEKQGDSQTLYTLDGEPSFVDHGARLEMAPGAGQSDEKIVAALLTAAQFYRGRIELTGSDEFKAKTIGLIAQHQINVEMKNPVQRALLDDARKALTAEPVVRDAIAGEASPAFGTLPAQPSNAAPETVPAQSQAVPVLEVEKMANVSQPAAPNRPAEPGPENVVAKSPGLSAEIHQPAEKAKDGVVGKVMECGVKPYHFDDKNDPSAYIKLRTKTGTQTFWGKELAGLMRDTRVQPGKMVTLQWLGKEAVVIKVPHKNEHGVTTHFEDKNAHRNQWALTVKGAATVRTGQDEGVKLAPYDAARFAVVQQAVINRLGLDVPVPTPPAQGLYWMTPNGQGSAKAGDELSAQRPAIDPRKSAGQPVISSWSQDGHLDMLLVRGDGPYLQGVVRQGNEFQHVLVSLPGTQDAPPMVFNAITPEGLVPIGTGNAINRSGGVPVSRENIAFKLEGDNATRIAKLDAPADIPPALHARLGFDERWKEDNSLPKSAPTAAPAAQPSDPRPA